MEERTEAEVNMKIPVKCKPLKSQTQKRHILLRISSFSDSEEK
jgi:hypothetical protein